MAFSPLIEAIAANSNATAIAFTSLLVFSFLCLLRRNLRASRLPPGPFAWPIIGNLLQLGEFPYRSLQQMANKHGPILYLNLGYFPTVVVSSSEMAREFLKTHDLAFSSRPKSAAGKQLAYNYQDVAFAPLGSYWKQMRKICVNELLSAKRLQSFTSIREEEICEVMWSIWEKSEKGKVGVNVSKFMTSLTSSIIWRILAGKRYCEDDVVGCGGELRDMTKEVAGTILEFNIGDFLPYLDWLDLQGIKRRMKKAHLFFDRVVQKIIDQHVKDNGEKMEESRVKDIIDILLDMASSGAEDITLENTKAIIFDMFIGGTETISTTLEWAMSEMLRNPHIATKVQEEIECVVGKHRRVRESDLPNLEYLQCVVKESLRLHPPVPLLVPRESTKACTVGVEGFVLPAKTRLMVNVWAIARDPAVWDDPLTFKPERFMGKDIDIKGRDFEMLPFGAGRRGCPGALMAMATVELTLAQMMHCFHWRVEGEFDMSEAFGGVLSRKENIFAIPTLKVSNFY